MSASTDKRCSRCKVTKSSDCFGNKKNGEEYKTCIKCRSKNNTNTVDNTTPIKTNKCLLSCYDPYRSIHDKKCKHFGTSCINMKYKPFLNYLDIIDTISGEYGYRERPLPIGLTTIPLTFKDIEDCRNAIDDIDFEISLSKTMCVVKYDGGYDFIKDMFIETLSEEARYDVNKHCPCYIVKFRHQSNMYTLVLRNCNSFKHFFIRNKLKHARKCNLCLEKTRNFMNCYRCGNKCCNMCVRKLRSLTCPFCNYDIIEHHCNMSNLYDISS